MAMSTQSLLCSSLLDGRVTGVVLKNGTMKSVNTARYDAINYVENTSKQASVEE